MYRVLVVVVVVVVVLVCSAVLEKIYFCHLHDLTQREREREVTAMTMEN